MLKHWRKFGYGALLGSAVGTMGCMNCGTCPPGGVCQTGAVCQTGIGRGRCNRPMRVRGMLAGCLHRRSGAIPDTFPLGKINEAWYYEMQTNAEAEDFVLHDLDFVAQTTELTSGGKDHILEIAARMRSTPFPVLVERSPNNADPELDQARRALVVQALCDLGNPDAAQRVVISTDYDPGYWSPQAQQMYYRHMLNGGLNGGGIGGAGGNGGMGAGGIGGGGFGGY